MLSGEPPEEGALSLRDGLVICLAYTVLTIALTYPQIARMGDAVGPHYDSLFSVWRLSWIGHQLTSQPTALFDANIFHPESNTLAYSDAILLLGIFAAPALWLGCPPVVAYNSLILLSFVSAGASMHVFARSLGVGHLAAAFAGIAFAFQPYRFAHYSQLELLWTCWIPLALWALHRVYATGRVVHGVLLGVFVTAQVFTCLYYAIYLVTALAVVAAALSARLTASAFVARLRIIALAALVAAACTTPYAIPYLRNRDVVGVRSADDVRRWSPTLRSYIIAQDGHWLYPSPSGMVDPVEAVLFPGLTVLALAGVGLFARRPGATVYAVLLVLSFDLSLGSNGLSYRMFYEYLGPYRGLRVPARIFVIVSTALAVLAAFGMQRLAPSRSAFSRIARTPVAPALLLLLIVELSSIPIHLASTPQVPIATYRWLARQPTGAVLEWPVARASNLGVTQAPRYMFYSTLHWQPLVNGYSGYHPGSHITLLDALRTLPDAESIRQLRQRGVRYVILHSAPDRPSYDAALRAISNHSAFTFQFREESDDEDVTTFILAER
jgi:hypothetical protein